jgi:peptidoglycan/xylan/chitin deacetylase (PgdA/CDA1 family)
MVGVGGVVEAGGRRLRRRVIVTVIAVSLLALAAFTLEPAWGSTRSGKEGALFRVPVRERVVALSFDDGPDPRWTPQILRDLAAHDAHATFFEIGDNALAHRDLVAAVLAAGNEIGNHTLDHRHLPDLTTGEVHAELTLGSEALVRAGAPRPTLFRPPLGMTDERVAEAARANGLQTVYWQACVEKFVNHTDVTAGTNALLRRVRPGAIILAHDGGIPDRSRTMQAIPQLLDGLQKRGYRVVTVSELQALGGRSHTVKRTS